ncbi:hypothetical protein ABIA27_002029 [Sinorhizobium fredii]
MKQTLRKERKIPCDWRLPPHADCTSRPLRPSCLSLSSHRVLPFAKTAVQVTALSVWRPRNAEDGGAPREEVSSSVDATANTALRSTAEARVQSGSGRNASRIRFRQRRGWVAGSRSLRAARMAEMRTFGTFVQPTLPTQSSRWTITSPMSGAAPNRVSPARRRLRRKRAPVRLIERGMFRELPSGIPLPSADHPIADDTGNRAAQGDPTSPEGPE